MNGEYRLTLPPKTAHDPDAQSVLERVRAEIGMIPNMYARLANSPGLLQTYLDGIDLFRRHSGFTPTEQEALFLAISRENSCDYCVAAHHVTARVRAKAAPEVLEALQSGGAIADAKLAALTAFAKVMVETRGRPSTKDVEAFLQAGYTERQILEVVLAVALKTITNYGNHLFQTPVDDIFRPKKPATAPTR